MKVTYLHGLLFIIFGIMASYGFSLASTSSEQKISNKKIMVKDSVLRHIVLFKFISETPPEKLIEIERAFANLPSKIPEILEFEWGTNNSPEGLDKGFTHSFLVTFNNENDRAAYLPHPDHKAFVDLASPYIEDVLVIDYWAE